MTRDDIQNLYKWMQEFAIRAGDIMLHFRGKVENIGKEGYDLSDSEYRADGAVKTKVDEIVQELFLSYIYNYPSVGVNAEEDTPIKFLLAEENASVVDRIVHLDPLDGTRDYLDMQDWFTVGVAISDANLSFIHTVIYAPVLDRLFIASPEGSRILDRNFVEREFNPAADLKNIYEKRLLSPAGREKLEKLGFVLEKPPPSHLGIINTVLGGAVAFLYGGSQVHDGLIPLAFAKARGSGPLNIEGRPLNTQGLRYKVQNRVYKFERVPSLCYFNDSGGEAKKEILEVLSYRENLHPEYLEKYAILDI